MWFKRKRKPNFLDVESLKVNKLELEYIENIKEITRRNQLNDRLLELSNNLIKRRSKLREMHSKRRNNDRKSLNREHSRLKTRKTSRSVTNG